MRIAFSLSATIIFVQSVSAIPTPFGFDTIASKRAAQCADEGGQSGREIKFPPAPTFTGLKKIPDAHHSFKPPGPHDRRGPCPALNTLANHGYISRDGITTPEEVVDAVTEGFNMHFEFARFLVSFATLARGNAFTGQLSIGRPSPRIPALPGGIDGQIAGGLATHGRFEGDVSMTRFDAAVGDNVNFQDSIYEGLLDAVALLGDDGPGGPHTIANEAAFAEHKFATFNEYHTSDPNMQYHVGRQFSAFGEVGFVLNMFPNGTEGGNGNLTVNMMNLIFRNQTFGDNWFRRSSPADFIAITTIAGNVRNVHPPAPGRNINGTYVLDPSNSTDFFCDAYADLAGNNLAYTLQNTTGILKRNVDTLVAAMFKPFHDNAGCTNKVWPRGPAGV